MASTMRLIKNEWGKTLCAGAILALSLLFHYFTMTEL